MAGPLLPPHTVPWHSWLLPTAACRPVHGCHHPRGRAGGQPRAWLRGDGHLQVALLGVQTHTGLPPPPVSVGTNLHDSLPFIIVVLSLAGDLRRQDENDCVDLKNSFKSHVGAAPQYRHSRPLKAKRFQGSLSATGSVAGRRGPRTPRLPAGRLPRTQTPRRAEVQTWSQTCRSRGEASAPQIGSSGEPGTPPAPRPRPAHAPGFPHPRNRGHCSQTHNDNRSNGPDEAPDQGVPKGQPAEVRVSVALGVQAHCQSWTTGWGVRASPRERPRAGLPSPTHTPHADHGDRTHCIRTTHSMSGPHSNPHPHMLQTTHTPHTPHTKHTRYIQDVHHIHPCTLHTEHTPTPSTPTHATYRIHRPHTTQQVHTLTTHRPQPHAQNTRTHHMIVHTPLPPHQSTWWADSEGWRQVPQTEPTPGSQGMHLPSGH